MLMRVEDTALFKLQMSHKGVLYKCHSLGIEYEPDDNITDVDFMLDYFDMSFSIKRKYKEYYRAGAMIARGINATGGGDKYECVVIAQRNPCPSATYNLEVIEVPFNLSIWRTNADWCAIIRREIRTHFKQKVRFDDEN